VIVTYTEAFNKAEELLKEQTELYNFLYERAALSKRNEAIAAWHSAAAAIYDLRDQDQYLEILKRE